MTKKLVITVDVGDRPEWQIRALQRQFADSIEKNKDFEGYYFMLFPVRHQPTNVFFLDGDPDSVADAKEIREIADKLRPVLRVALDEANKEANKPKSPRGGKEGPQILE